MSITGTVPAVSTVPIAKPLNMLPSVANVITSK